MLCRTAVMAAFPSLVEGWRPVSLGSVDHPDLPLRCHWADPADEPRCALVLSVAQAAWEAQVDQIGFHPPMPDADGRLDLYLSDEGTSGGAYAYGPSEDEDPTDGRMGCHAYLVLDPVISDLAMPSYVAHEFNHILQYATDFTEPSLPVWEATATAAEVWTLPGHRPQPSYVEDFQEWPWMGLLGDGYRLYEDYGIWSYHEYGAVIWILHLDQTWGSGDGAMGAALWAAMENPDWGNDPDLMAAWAAVAGGSWEDARVELAALQLVAGTALAPAWAQELGNAGWFAPAAEVVDAAAASGGLSLELDDPGIYPTGLVVVELDGVEAGLRVQAAGPDGVRLALVAVDAAGQRQVGEGAGLELELTGDLRLAVVHLDEPDLRSDWPLRPDAVTLQIGEPVAEDTGEPPLVDDTGSGSDGGAGGGRAKAGCASAPRGGAWIAGAAIGAIGALRRRRAPRA
jgi:hypothetical protein